MLTIAAFMTQQLQIIIRYQGKLGEMRTQSAMQLFSYMSMLGTFLPLRWYLLPVSVVYTGSYWSVYALCTNDEQEKFEVICRFMSNLTLFVIGAIMVQEAMKSALESG